LDIQFSLNLFISDVENGINTIAKGIKLVNIDGIYSGDVKMWLDGNGFGLYSNKFLGAGVIRSILLTITDNEMKLIGVDNSVIRKSILNLLPNYGFITEDVKQKASVERINIGFKKIEDATTSLVPIGYSKFKKGFEVLVESGGSETGKFYRFILNGTPVNIEGRLSSSGSNCRGINIVILDPSFNIIFTGSYDTTNSKSESEELIKLLRSIRGNYVILGARKEISDLPNNLIDEFENVLGLKQIRTLTTTCSWAFIVRKTDTLKVFENSSTSTFCTILETADKIFE